MKCPEGQKGARFSTEIRDLDHVAKALRLPLEYYCLEIRYLPKIHGPF